MLSTSNIRTIHIPQYDGLGVKDIKQYLDEKHPEVYHYLPEPSLELPKVPKQWLANVCATVLKEEFSQWVKDRQDGRHLKVAEKGDLMIQMDPEVKKVFEKSIAVSSKFNFIQNILISICLYSSERALSYDAEGRKQEKTNQVADLRREKCRGAGAVTIQG